MGLGGFCDPAVFQDPCAGSSPGTPQDPLGWCGLGVEPVASRLGVLAVAPGCCLDSRGLLWLSAGCAVCAVCLGRRSVANGQWREWVASW